MRVVHSFLLITLLAVIGFSARGFAQESNFVPKESIVKRAFEVCPTSLKSDVPGIVESTIYNIILIKKYYPAANYAPISRKLNELAEESNDPSIRYKAHLASIYLSFSDIIEVKPAFQVYDREYIFRQIAEQLESKLLVSN